MKETNLLKTALVCAFLGLIILYFISEKTGFKDYKPNNFNENAGEDVKLTGTIAKISQNDGVAFIEVNYQSPVTVILFTTENNLSLNTGDSIEVLGEVQEYKGKNEVIAENIRVIG